jgi:hypothetical protein
MLRLRALLPVAIALACVGVVNHRGPAEAVGSATANPCPADARLVGHVDPYGHRTELCEKLDPDGRPVAEGPWTAWHANGTPSAHGRMRDGRQVGPWTFWSEAGVVIETVDFGDGTPLAAPADVPASPNP